MYKILQNARKEYIKLQSDEKGFQGDNHVFILDHFPYTPLTPVRLYKIFKTFMKNFSLCSSIEGFSELSMTSTGGHSMIQSTRRCQHPMLEKTRADMEKLEKSFDKTIAVVNN